MSGVHRRVPVAHEIIWNSTGGRPWLFTHGARLPERGWQFLLVPTNQYMKRVWKEFHAKQAGALKGADIDAATFG